MVHITPKLIKEQYDILQEKANEFYTLVNHGYCRNLNGRFQSRMKEFYKDHFHAPVNMNCKECVVNVMRKLNNLMEDYKAANEKELT